jgi:hypothetical protein
VLQKNFKNLFGNHFEIVFEKIAKSPPQKCEVSWTKALLPISSKSHSAAKSNFSKNHIPKRFLEIEKISNRKIRVDVSVVQSAFTYKTRKSLCGEVEFFQNSFQNQFSKKVCKQFPKKTENFLGFVFFCKTLSFKFSQKFFLGHEKILKFLFQNRFEVVFEKLQKWNIAYDVERGFSASSQ